MANTVSTQASNDSPLVARQKADAANIEFNPAIPPASFSEAVDAALATGDDATVVLDPWEKLNQDKSPLVDRPFVLQHVKFMTDRETSANFANMFVVREDDRLFRVTDGSTGMYSQIAALVQDRLNAKHAHPYGPFVFPNGLRVSEFGIDKNGKAVTLGDPSQVGKGATYYFA